MDERSLRQIGSQRLRAPSQARGHSAACAHAPTPRRPPRLLPSFIRVLGERAPCACPAAELLIKLRCGEAQLRRRESARRRPRPDTGRGGGVRARAERKPPGPEGREVGRVPACRGPGRRRCCCYYVEFGA
ncbi:hypothetical protein J1605_014742 [Eschrichtius robustus]|uniref:Uncharacterized protein n=1 Tax=Eschrichtius robustus TaxID=9764 RepID=A0AB34GCA2_ESCRO|nr:hypothetical protein J1605_014742 [Eschrichtius robustus]